MLALCAVWALAFYVLAVVCTSVDLPKRNIIHKHIHVHLKKLENRTAAPYTTDDPLPISHMARLLVDTPMPKANPNSNSNFSEVVILVYAKMYSSMVDRTLLARDEKWQTNFEGQGCLGRDFPKNTKCRVSFDRDEIDRADLVFFGETGIAKESPFPWPDHARAMHNARNVPWVIASKEATVHRPALYDPELMAKFNLTFTYQAHRADIHWPYAPLGFSFRLFDLPVDIASRNASVPVVYIASNCRIVANQRNRYVDEMSKIIPIASFGRCMHNQDLKDDRFAELAKPIPFEFTEAWSRKEMERELALENVLQSHLGQYKFYLSFENANCESYVTEKYWRALELGLIPVILGANNAHRYAINNHSAIYASDFGSARELAEYLVKVNGDDELFRSYLAYKFDPSLVSQAFMDAYRYDQQGCEWAHLCRAAALFQSKAIVPAHRNLDNTVPLGPEPDECEHPSHIDVGND